MTAHLLNKSGHLAFKSGHLVSTTNAADCDCCEPTPTPCILCDDATPATFTCTIAGVSNIVGCVSCGDFTTSMQYVSGAAINGTYSLKQVPGTPCCWSAVVNNPTVNIYQGSPDCGASGSPTANTISAWTILLCRFDPGGGNPVQWQFGVTGGAAGYFTQQFDTDNQTLTANCEDNANLPTFLNQANGICGFGTYFAGNGGTAVISFP